MSGVDMRLLAGVAPVDPPRADREPWPKKRDRSHEQSRFPCQPQAQAASLAGKKEKTLSQHEKTRQLHWRVPLLYTAVTSSSLKTGLTIRQRSASTPSGSGAQDCRDVHESTHSRQDS